MNETIAKYTFLPWMRQGVANRLSKTDHLGKDADQQTDTQAPGIDLTVLLHGEKREKGSTGGNATSISVPKQIQLYHTGDITGIERRAIVKTEPGNRVQQFETNFLPYIDFYEEDFPWRYTPVAPNRERLRPWVALVVLKEEEFEKESLHAGSPLGSFKLQDDLSAIPFPPAYQLWAWAHVHINRSLDTDSPIEGLKSILSQDPNLACSRIICPRKLEPETAYFAFLIPAFERGRLAGLGAASEVIDQTDIQLAAWGHEQDHFEGFTAYHKRFPIYYEWTFSTGKAGADFETLAKKIVPGPLHEHVGKRLVDMQSPGYNLSYDGGPFPNQGTMIMEGALRHPDSKISNLLEDSTEESKAFVQGLADLINLEEDLKTKAALPADHTFATNPYFPEADETIYDDPILLPPLYGRWHARQDRVSPDKIQRWVNQLNLDPRHRIAAGLGAEVVRRNQEEYMDRAWGQFGDLFNANAFIKRSQLTLEVSSQLYKKHISTLPPAKLVSVSATAHERLRDESFGTPDAKISLKVNLHEKRVPDGIFSSSYEKVIRRGGGLTKRISTLDPTNIIGLTGTLSLQIADRTEPVLTAGELFSKPDIVTGQVIVRVEPGTYVRALLFNAFEELGKSSIPPWKRTALLHIGVPRDFQNGNFRAGLGKIAKDGSGALADYFAAGRWEPETKKDPVNLSTLHAGIKKNLHPRLSLYKKISHQRKEMAIPEAGEADAPRIAPIVKAPEFEDATYEDLLNISLEDFVPNLDLVAPNTSGILEVNRPFIESFMVGLNYEMGRELLWREFPTDQRGTYFSLFWDAGDFNARARATRQPTYKDIRPIHEWAGPTTLGTHPQADGTADQLVVVIRGDLLNRYPNTLVYLEKAQIRKKERQLSGIRIHPIFEAKVAPDIHFLGFDISKEEVLDGEGYFFVFQERPGEVHFGLDSEEDSTTTPLISWDQLNWSHLEVVNHHIDVDQHAALPVTDEAGQFFWGRGSAGDQNEPESGEGSSADMAAILYQSPVKIAIHTTAMLPK